MKLLIQDGLIIDGSGERGFFGSVLVEGDRIVDVYRGKHVPEEILGSADQIINVKGLTVAPGFIDTHSHSDLKALTEPDLLPKIMQGITTEVLGQDGISMAPLPIQYIEPWRKNLAGLEGESDEIDWTYEITENYLKMLETSKPSTNQSYLLPHGNVRMEAMGLSNEAATPEQIERMKEITRREMKAGCYGLSSGLIYMPCAYSNTEELIELCKVVKEYDGVFVVHQRSEADDILESMEEVLRIGRESGVKVHFSHFKVCGRKNWHKLDRVFELLEGGTKEGLTVSFDQYPYVAGSTMLSVILPPWMHDGGSDELIHRLNDRSLRKRIFHDIDYGIPGWDNLVEVVGLENIYITSVSTKENEVVIGMNLLQLGEHFGSSPLDATLDLLAIEKNAVGMVDFYGLEEHILQIMMRPEMNACTDGLLGGKPHPRGYGAFSRILRKYVREERAMTVESAIRKMTAKAAEALGIEERGLIRKDYIADLTIFDPKQIEDTGDFVNPAQFPKGIHYVIVNGNITVDNGKYNGQRWGKVLRKRSL